MIGYILEVSLCWLVFYMLYAFWLSKETFFTINRGYLLTTLLLGLIIPLIELPDFYTVEESLAGYYLEPITIGVAQLETVIITTASKTTLGHAFNGMNILIWIYWIGVAVGVIRLGYGLLQIYKLYRVGTITQMQGYYLVQTNEPHLPFSFFNYLFWNNGLTADKTDIQKIMRHEEAHIRQGHSLDVILLELLSILLWCSPLIHFYKKSLRILHEYLADDFVLQISKKKTYGRLLLQQSQSGFQIALANNLFHSQLKKRIVMMTKNKSRQHSLMKYLVLIPLAALLLLAFSNEAVMAKINPLEKIKAAVIEAPHFDETTFKNTLQSFFDDFDFKTIDEQIIINEKVLAFVNEQMILHPTVKTHISKIHLTMAQLAGVPFCDEMYDENDKLQASFRKGGDVEMPRFAGCENLETLLEKKTCSKKKLFEFIGNNLQYPKAAKAANVRGLVMIKFTVAVNGSIENASILKDLSHGCGEEALRVVQMMPKWIPGQKEGKVVAIEQTLPFKFWFEDEKISAEERGEKTFKVVEEMPAFAGCETVSLEERQKCSNKNLISFIMENIHYPKEAKMAGKEGTVVVNFIIEKDGSITEPKVIVNLHPSCDAEALRMVQMMPKWTPGKHNEESVRVEFNLPFKFKLDDKDKKTLPPNTKKFNENGEVFKVVEEMPRFPGCEDLDSALEKNKCSKRKLIDFIIEHMKYPKEAKEAAIEGMAVINFIVDKEGNITHINMSKSLEKYCDAEAMRVIQMMPTWIPGKQGGKNVAVEMNLPVKFKLDNEAKATTKKPQLNSTQSLKVTQFNTYPNPTEKDVTIEFQAPAGELNLKIIDATGKEVYQKSWSDYSGGFEKLTKIDVSSASKGTLFIILSDGEGQHSETIVLQ